MKKIRLIGLAVTLGLSLFLSSAARAGEAPVYPGAVFDKKASETAQKLSAAAGNQTSVSIYSTPDSYEKVRQFYLSKGKVSTIPQRLKLPNGKTLQQSSVIFDGAASLDVSKSWGTVQYPFIGGIKMSKSGPVFEDLRQATGIVLVNHR